MVSGISTQNLLYLKMEDSSSSLSSAGSSIVISDSLTAMEEFPGFAAGDTDSDDNVSDPFQGIFYHIMSLQDSTDILFYNKPIFKNILTVLSKQFSFPSEETVKFQLKTYLDQKKCILRIDKSVMSLCASGPGHISWKQKIFRKLAQNVFRTFVQENSSLLDINMVSTSFTQEDNEALIDEAVEEPETEPPTGAEAQQPEQVVEYTHLQDSPVIRQISTLMDMISTLQGQITTLTTQVNDLVQQASNQSVIRTVDQSTDKEVQQEEILESSNEVRSAITPNTSDSHLPSPASELPDLQTSQYSDVVRRTSTPIDLTNATPQRPRPAPRTLPGSNSRSLPGTRNTNQILLIGDSLVSSVNPKGLRDNVVKNGISGGNIEKILTQIKVYDIMKFSHVIIYVGGNDASNGTDIEYFEERYDQLLQFIKESNSQCKILMSNSCPRGDTSTSDINDIIQALAEYHGAKFIDQYKAFHDRHGNIIEGYYDTDSIHLSSSGVKRLLGTIHREVTIVNDFARCFFDRRPARRTKQQQKQHQRRQPRSGGWRNSQEKHRDQNNVNLCHKCGESNHETINCKHKHQLKCYHCGLLGHKSGRCVPKL